MPMFKALRLCPDAVVVRPDMAKYVAAARRIRALMGRLTPLVQPLSIDEAVLDLSGTAALHRAPPAAVLARFALEVEREVGVTVSVGLAPNRLLAKIAAERDKPRGFAVIGAAEAASLLAPEPVTLLPGVGPAMARRLEAAGFTRLGQLAALSPLEAARRFGEDGPGLAARARGEDARPVVAGAGNAEHQRRDHLRRRPFVGGGIGTAALADVREAVAAPGGEGLRRRRRGAEAEDGELRAAHPPRAAACADGAAGHACSPPRGRCCCGRRTGRRSD